ncbi:hypothetical protein [Flavobacterium sp.]|jgi:hypothetical protein|uniref:hypothetical protein n=1 Tax=Flavobacterium sp. TaxID=239 RepID=UPI0037BE8B88
MNKHSNLPTLKLQPFYNNDPDIQELSIFNLRTDDFEPDEIIQGCAINIEPVYSELDELFQFIGLYMKKGPTSHSSLRSSVRKDADIDLPTPNDAFRERGYVHGFYTNKGKFITRRQALFLIEHNGLKTAVPVSEMNSLYGAMSSDIWVEGSSSATVTAAKDETLSDTLGNTADIRIPQSKSVKPFSVSDMMRLKREKKKQRRRY